MHLIDLHQDLVQVALDVRCAETAQAVVRAQLDDYDRRTVLQQQPGQALPPAQRSLATDAGVNNFEFGAPVIKLLLQQAGPAFCYIDTITC